MNAVHFNSLNLGVIMRNTHTQKKMGKGKRVGEGGSLVPLQLIIGWSHGEGEGPRCHCFCRGREAEGAQMCERDSKGG